MADNSRKKLRDNRKRLGLCAKCGSSAVVEGRVRCQRCIDKHQDYLSRRVKQAQLLGACVRCGSLENVITGNLSFSKSNQLDKDILSYCEECYLKRFSLRIFNTASRWNELKELLEKQQHLCAYSGEKLVLGVNASLDHKNPKSRFPDSASDIDNLEWTTFTVNLMKRDMTQQEFLSLIEKIHLYKEKS